MDEGYKGELSMKRKNLSLFMIVLVLLQISISMRPIQLTSAETKLNKSNSALLPILIERGANYEIWDNGDGTYSWRSAPQWIWSEEEQKYVPYVFHDNYTSEGYYEVSTGLISARIYDYYAVFYAPGNFSDVRLYDERWEVQHLRKNGKWSDIGAQSGTPIFTISKSDNCINITKAFHSWAGWLNITYVFHEGSPLKHEVIFKSEISSTETFRVVQKWAGIVAAKLKHSKGEDAITSAKTIDSPHFKFLKEDGSLSIFEDQWDMYYEWVPIYNETTGKRIGEELRTKSNQNLKPVEIDVHAKGLKADFVFGNWTLTQGETLRIDPDTATISPPSADSFITNYPGQEDSNKGTSDRMHVGGRDGSYKYDTVLKFDLSSLSGEIVITSAKLRLYCYNTESTSQTVYVYDMSTDWTETGITWNNAPAADALITSKTVSSTGWVNFTVTDAVNYLISDGVIAFRLKGSSTTKILWFYSKEYDGYDPQLVVTYNVVHRLVGYWRFDEGSGGTAGDSSGLGNDGTIYGASWVDGKYGKALSFDGDDYVKVFADASHDITDEVTIEAWVKSNNWSPSATKRIVTKNNYWNLDCSGFDTAKWYHIVGTYSKSAGKATLYVNGEVFAEEFVTGDITGGTEHAIYIGRKYVSTDFWDGLIDEVRIYNRALSPEEIQALYSTPPPSITPSITDISYEYAVPIFINSDRNLTDYVVGLRLHSGSGTNNGKDIYLNGKAQSDFDDIRFYDLDGQPLSYFKSVANSTMAMVWVKVPNITAGTTVIFMCYGNPSATDASDGEETFVFFDDFLGTSLNYDKWDFSKGYGISTWGVENSYFYVDIPATAEAEFYLMSDSAYTGNYSVEARVRADFGALSGEYVEVGLMKQFNLNTEVGRNKLQGGHVLYLCHGGFWGTDTRQPYVLALVEKEDSDTGDTVYHYRQWEANGFTNDAWEYVGLGWYGTTVRSWKWGDPFKSYTSTVDYSKEAVKVSAGGESWTGAGYIHYKIDWVGLRKFVYPEPIIDSWSAFPILSVSVEITDMEGCGDWVFAEEKYYTFKVTASSTVIAPELFDSIKFAFNDSVNWINYTYNAQDDDWSLVVDNDIVRVRPPTSSITEDSLIVTIPVYFTKYVIDSLDRDIYAWVNLTSGSSTGWRLVSPTYFNIYNLGGAANDTFIGYAGRRSGGDVFELYAGPGGQEVFYEETFDGYTEGENPPGWIIYEPNATTKTEVTLTSLLWAGHSYPLGLRLRDKTNENYYAYAKYKFGTVTDNFKVQFFLTTAEGGDSAIRLDYNNQPGPVIVADGQGWPYGSILKFRNSSGLFPLDNSVTLTDGTFYNITLDINMATKTYDIYVDDVLKHSGAEFNDTSISALNTITLTTYAISLTEYSDFTVDDIKMWYGTSQTGMGIAQTTVAFRNLQHMHTLFAVGIPNGDAYIADPNEGFVEFGIDYCIDDEWINNAWKVRINMTDARLVGYTFWSHVTGNPPADWIKLDISWYTHNTTYVKTDTIYTYWEGQGGSADWFRLWLDLWFNKINASSTVGGRVGTYYYGVEDQSNPWLRLVSGANWGIKAQEHTHSLFFAPLTDAEGNVVSASRIKMVRIRCKVWRSANEGYKWELRNFDVLNYRFAPDTMQGVDTPTFQSPRMPTLPSSGLLASLQAALQSSMNALIEHLVTASLYMFPIFVGFMDNIFAYFGYPGLFSTILNAASNFFTYFALTLNYTAQFLPPLFDVLSNTFSFIISYLINFINVYIQIATIVKGILDGTYTITTGFGNIWELMNVEGWDEAIPLFLFIAWMVSIDGRARRAKKYGVGWTEIFVRDVKVIMDVVSFILHLFTTIADWSIGLILKIISAIPL